MIPTTSTDRIGVCPQCEILAISLRLTREELAALATKNAKLLARLRLIHAADCNHGTSSLCRCGAELYNRHLDTVLKELSDET